MGIMQRMVNTWKQNLKVVFLWSSVTTVTQRSWPSWHGPLLYIVPVVVMDSCWFLQTVLSVPLVTSGKLGFWPGWRDWIPEQRLARHLQQGWGKGTEFITIQVGPWPATLRFGSLCELLPGMGRECGQDGGDLVAGKQGEAGWVRGQQLNPGL